MDRPGRSCAKNSPNNATSYAWDVDIVRKLKYRLWWLAQILVDEVVVVYQQDAYRHTTRQVTNA